MKIQNTDFSSIETMTTKDVLRFVEAILGKFKNSDSAYTSSWILYQDKKAPLNTVVELLIQVISKEGESVLYKATFLRATNWNCSNSISFTEMAREDFLQEVQIYKRINELF
jgi:DNA-binding protein